MHVQTPQEYAIATTTRWCVEYAERRQKALDLICAEIISDPEALAKAIQQGVRSEPNAWGLAIAAIVRSVPRSNQDETTALRMLVDLAVHSEAEDRI